jgi:hypothetical protein
VIDFKGFLSTWTVCVILAWFVLVYRCQGLCFSHPSSNPEGNIMQVSNTDNYIVVDTCNGLKIVECNTRNYFNDKYAVQFIGTYEQCKVEVSRLKVLEY